VDIIFLKQFRNFATPNYVAVDTWTLAHKCGHASLAAATSYV